jgi:hypothetical protein
LIPSLLVDLGPILLKFDIASRDRENVRQRGPNLFRYELPRDGAIIFADLIGKLDAPYKSGPLKAWLKIKNPKAPAATHALDGAF